MPDDPLRPATAANPAQPVTGHEAGNGAGEVGRLLTGLASVAQQLGDTDAAESVQAEADAVTAHAARVVVVGEKKRGKSSLINALLRRPGLLPVDADIATSVHISVYAADRDQAHVVENDDPEGREITLAQVSEYAALDPDTMEMLHPGVQEVRVGLPDPLLRAGVELIDTPGVGGLVSGHAALTLEALSLADALMFVVDGSGELTKSECEFLAQATQRVATVMFVLTQIDKYPDWRQVAKADQALIAEHARRFKDAKWFPVSSRLRLDAVRAAEVGDAARAGDLEERSGFTSLEEMLTGQIAGRADKLRGFNAIWVARAVLTKLIATQERRMHSLAKDPDLITTITATSERLDNYRRVDAAWRQDLDRGLRELTAKMTMCYQRRLAELKIDADGWAAEARTATTTQITHDLDSGVRALWTEVEKVERSGALQIAANIARQLETEGIDILGVDVPYPEQLRYLPGLRHTLEGEQGGISGTLNRYWPSMSGFSVTSMAGHLLFASVNPLAIIGVGAIVAAGLFRAGQARSETIQLRSDVQRYVRAVLTRVEAEMPTAIQASVEMMKNALDRLIADRIRAKESELRAARTEAREHLNAAEEELVPQRAATEQTIRRLRELANAATQLTTPTAASAFGMS